MFEKTYNCYKYYYTKYNLCLMNNQVKIFTNNKVYFILILKYFCCIAKILGFQQKASVL